MFIIVINKPVKIMEQIGGQDVFSTNDFKSIYANMFADDVSSLSDTPLQLYNALEVVRLLLFL